MKSSNLRSPDQVKVLPLKNVDKPDLLLYRVESVQRLRDPVSFDVIEPGSSTSMYSTGSKVKEFPFT